MHQKASVEHLAEPFEIGPSLADIGSRRRAQLGRAPMMRPKAVPRNGQQMCEVVCLQLVAEHGLFEVGTPRVATLRLGVARDNIAEKRSMLRAVRK